LTKLGIYLDLKRIWNRIDFQGQRSRSQGLIFRRGDTPRFALPLFYIYFAPFRTCLRIMGWGYWNRCTRQEYYNIEQIQHEVAIITSGLPNFSSLELLYFETGWEPLHSRRRRRKLNMFYKTFLFIRLSKNTLSETLTIYLTKHN
jgi:hypothetical protein